MERRTLICGIAIGFGGCISLGQRNEDSTLDSEIAVFNEFNGPISIEIIAFSNDEVILDRTIDLGPGKGNESTSTKEVPSEVSIRPQKLPERTIDIDVRDSCKRVDVGVWIRQDGIEHNVNCLS